MTEEELKQEAFNWTKKNISLGVSMYNPSIEMYCAKAYEDGAAPREKQIEIDAEQIRALQKQNGELTDELTLTNNECKDMREELKQRIRENQKLCEQIEKMKCCGNCKYYQFQNDAGYYTCIKDGKRNGKNYRSCEFDLEKWEGR